ncbi:MAG: adenylate/guanylate cyclase domain-containing protein [Leptolyngbya sp. SIO1E4]|nr:adenylate/guanylate cyclase domain-containing protein [Leptolyngbya sp. SIO1E4]
MVEQRTPPFRDPRKSAAGNALKATVGQVIAQASLKNERNFAYVRAIVLIISSLLDSLIFFFPQTLLGQASVSPTIALLSTSASLVAAGILIILLQPSAWRWLTGLQTFIPLFDSVLLALFITNIWRVLGESNPEIITNIAAFCCLLAVSGGIRIRRRASVLTTVLALANFVYAAILFQLDTAVSLFVLFTIFGTGMIGMLTTGIVRRQGKNEAGRLLMRQFLPENIVEAAFESPIRLLEEPRECEVTIMVTDLRNFTHYSEKLDPLAVMDFLNQLQGFLSSSVEQQGGWVDKFMGDGMLAVFGAPRTLENHAEQALQAAQTILRDVRHWSPLPIGISLHSGSIVAGCLGTDGHLEFTVIGDTVNVASRLEALTKEVNHSLLISQTTQRKLRNGALVSLGEMPIRGRDERIEVYTLP